MSTIVDSTGVQIEIYDLEFPASILHPVRSGREHPVEHCYLLSHQSMRIGIVWGFRKVGKTKLSWRGMSDRTGCAIGDFGSREAAIGAVVIEALRRNERFTKLDVAERSKLLLPTPRKQRDIAFHHLVSELGGGADARRIAETMRANREAVDRWCLAMMQVDERVKAEAALRDNLKKSS